MGNKKSKAASMIQRAYRRRMQSKKKDNIKTAKDVKDVIADATPASVVIQETNLSLTAETALGTGGPTVQQSLSDIVYSNSNDTPNTRKSKKITALHVKCRCYLEVGDRVNLCRVMVVRNKDPMNAVLFDPKEMFKFNNNVGTQPDQMYSEVNTRKVQVKYDRVFQIQDSSESYPAVRPRDYYFEFKVDFHETWKYLTESNNTSEFTRNMKDYYIVAFSDSQVLPNPALKVVSFTWFKNHTR